MNSSPSSVTARAPFQGVRQIVRFNWPFYVAGTLACVVGLLGVVLVPLPPPFGLILSLAIWLALFWIVMSLAVSFYVYDYSSLYKWDWILGWLPATPGAWANIHAGFDETSLALRQLFPSSETVTFSIHDAQSMTEASIKRARALFPPLADTISATADRLPMDNDSLDAVFLIFAAHEVRDPEKRMHFFFELQRVLRIGGHILIVEHVRDWANFIAFGPGFLHFLPRSVWHDLAERSGSHIIREERIAAFVRVFLLERHA